MPRQSCWCAEGEFQDTVVSTGSLLTQEQGAVIQCNSGLGEFLCSRLVPGQPFHLPPKSGVSLSQNWLCCSSPQRVMGPEGCWQGQFLGQGQVPWEALRPGREDVAVPVGLISMALTLAMQM